jgi:hypothetical protein
MNELKRSTRRGRSLLAAGAGMAMAAASVGCGVHGVYGVYGVEMCELPDGGPCFVPEDAGGTDAGDSGVGPADSGPFGIIIHPDGGDAG